MAGHQIHACVVPVPAGVGIKPLGTVSIEAGSECGEHQITATIVEDPDIYVDERVLVVASSAQNGTPRSNGNGQLALATHPGELDSNDWATFFARVEEGGTGLVGAMRPADDVAVRAFANRGFDVQFRKGLGNWLPCYHWIRDTPVFAGLPVNGLAGEVYAEVLPRYVLHELGGEVLAGTIRSTQTRREDPKMLWSSDVEILDYGRGKLIFCQYRVFDPECDDPVGLRLRDNLLQFAQTLGHGSA
jgi:hypothetical protein